MIDIEIFEMCCAMLCNNEDPEILSDEQIKEFLHIRNLALNPLFWTHPDMSRLEKCRGFHLIQDLPGKWKDLIR
jgi:hypothetical protein